MDNVVKKFKLIKHENPDEITEKEYRRIELSLMLENQNDDNIKNALELLRRSYFWWQSKKEK